jgi:hypothetical protein
MSDVVLLVVLSMPFVLIGIIVGAATMSLERGPR